LEKFRQLKEEIKQRKEAKEQIVAQGYPRLKPYARI